VASQVPTTVATADHHVVAVKALEKEPAAVELVDMVSEQGRNYATDQVPTATATSDTSGDHVVEPAAAAEPAAAEPAAAELVNTLVDSGVSGQCATDQVPTAAATSATSGDHVVEPAAAAEPAAVELVNTLVSEQGRNYATDQVPTATATSDHAGGHVVEPAAAAEPAAVELVNTLVSEQGVLPATAVEELINRYRSDIEYLQGSLVKLLEYQHGKVTQQQSAVEVLGIQEEEQDGAVTALDMLLREKMKSKVDYTHAAAIEKLTGGLNTIGDLMSNVGERCQMVLELVDGLLCEAATVRQPKVFLQNLPEKMRGIRESLIEMRQSVVSSPDQPGPSTVGPENPGGPSGKSKRLNSDFNVKAKKHKASDTAVRASDKAKNVVKKAKTLVVKRNERLVDSDGDTIYSDDL
jgi:hypothetical protein